MTKGFKAWLRGLLDGEDSAPSCPPPHAAKECMELVQGVLEYAIFLLDSRGNVMSWNTGAESIKGYRPEEILGQHFSRFYPPDQIASGWPAYELEQAAQTGRFADEGWRLRKDGTRFWANVAITTLRDPDGKVTGFLKVTRDLTERRNAEAKLKLSEERFRLLIDSVEEYAIFMLDPSGIVTTWNAGAERIKGHAPEEIIGQHFSRFYPLEDIEAGKPARELEIATARGRFEEEGWRLRKDGSRFWANVVLTALRDETGTLRGFGKVTRDLTQRRAAEENERRLLQEEANRRTAELNAKHAQRAHLLEMRQREWLEVTLSSIGDAVIVTDREGLVTFINPVAQEVSGWHEEDARGKPLETVFPIVNESTRQPVENPVAKVLREGVIVGLANHTVLLARDGREIPIDDSAAPIRGEDGEIAGVILVFRDVTEQRRTAEARAHLAAIVESSEDAIISQDLEGRIVSWNHAAVRMYGYTAEEIMGRPHATLVPDDHVDEAPALFERIRRGERIEHLETVRRRKDGTLMDVSITMSPIRTHDGGIIGVSKIARDVTSIKRNETALRILAEASKLLADPTEATAGLRRVAELLVPPMGDVCTIDLADVEGETHRLAEVRRRRPGGTVTREHDRLEVAIEARGQDLGRICLSSQDPGRLLGESDRRFLEDLAQRAAAALENAKLYQDLREADRRKDEFLAMLSHELRNPLAPIQNGLQIMERAGTRADLADLHEQARRMIGRQVKHMVRLVEDLLDVSRVVRGKIELRREVVDLRSLIAHAIELSQPQMDSQAQQLVLAVPEGPLWLEVDPARIAQVLGNIVHNAAKFSPRGGSIHLSAAREGGDAVVRVRDEGPGMRKELLPQVFELFVQGDSTLERSRGGLGIGLTVARRLVELHGGRIAAASEGPGRGSEFTVRLPLTDKAPDTAAAPTFEPGETSVTPRRVLLVDDNEDAAESLALLLRASGHDVRVAFTGQKALALADEFAPEAVILDIGLPGMNGYEVAQRLRQQPRFEKALMIALTGYSQETDRNLSRGAGFDHHLTKPVDFPQLEVLLEGERS